MPRFDLTLDIARPPDDVFALLTDIERLPEWQESAITASADGELGVGTVIGEQRRFMGRDIKTTDEVTAYEPPRRFDVKSRGGPVAYEIHHVLEPDGTGTRLRVDVDVQVGAMMRLVAQAPLKAAERELRSDFERLKQLVETS
ncbi:MAG: SRPBCC family protein [Gaiellaceae bacterium]|jgi:carbon monoxide dehydrogenase subunit G